MSSLHRCHANLLCIIPILLYVLPKQALVAVLMCSWADRSLASFWSHLPLETISNVSFCGLIEHAAIIVLLLFSFSVVSNSLRPHGLQTTSFPVLRYFPEFTQTHVHWIGNAIQPSHPLLSPSAPAFSLSQHQGLFQWVGSSHQLAKVLDLQLQHQPFQWIFRVDIL